MRSDEAFVADMLVAARSVMAYLEGVSLESLMNDVILRDAVRLQVVVLGEAARNVSTDYQADHPEIPWASIIGMRNMLVHQYFRTDIEILWDTAKNDLPTLMHALTPLVPKDAIAGDELED
jgi:uncharacterized protein with HEPN domain